MALRSEQRAEFAFDALGKAGDSSQFGEEKRARPQKERNHQTENPIHCFSPESTAPGSHTPADKIIVTFSNMASSAKREKPHGGFAAPGAWCRFPKVCCGFSRFVLS
jgi:hypothetical protein